MALITGLESYFKLDETSGDEPDAHGSNTLTDNDTVAAATGIINGARDFEKGNSEFLSHADNASLSVTAGTGFTWSVWLKLESLSAGGGFEETILGKSNFGASTEYILYLNSSNHFVFYCGNGTTGTNADAGFVASINVWYHIIAWYDPASGGTNNIKVNNGTPVSVANTAGIYDGATEFRMGACSDLSRRFDGLIDEVAFFKRVLTSGEHTTLFNSGNAYDYSLFGIWFRSAANSGYTAATNSFSGSASWSGTQRMLAIDVSMLGPGVTVTSMTYGGAACTFIGGQSTVTSFGRIEQWRIIQGDPGAPAAGANTLAITLSGSVAFAITWTAYSGVHQTSPTEAFNSAQATNVGAADATVTITTVAVDDWVHGAIATDDTSVTANQTTRNNVTGAGGSGADEDTGPIVTPGATTISYTGVGALATWAIAGYAIRPVLAPVLGLFVFCPEPTPQKRRLRVVSY